MLVVVTGLIIGRYLRRYEETIHLTRLCLDCGYDLHHNTSGRCPECGKPIPAKQRAFLERNNG